MRLWSWTGTLPTLSRDEEKSRTIIIATAFKRDVLNRPKDITIFLVANENYKGFVPFLYESCPFLSSAEFELKL